MDTKVHKSVEPSVYLRTWKTYVLCGIKAIEAILAGIALYFFITAIIKLFNDEISFETGMNGFTIEAFFGIFSGFFYRLAVSVLALAAFGINGLFIAWMILLAVLVFCVMTLVDGISFILLITCGIGARAVRQIHFQHMLFSWLSIIISVCLLGKIVVNINEMSKASNVSLTALLGNAGVARLIILFLFLLGIPAVMSFYHRNVFRILGPIDKEALGNKIIRWKTRYRLDLASIIIAVAYLLALISLYLSDISFTAYGLSTVSVFGMSDLLSHMGKEIITIGPLLALVIKYIMVYLFAKDFAKAHRRIKQMPPASDMNNTRE